MKDKIQKILNVQVFLLMIQATDLYNGFSSIYDSDDFCQREIKKAKLTNAWRQILSMSDNEFNERFKTLKSRKILKSLVLQGIPIDLRVDIWYRFAVLGIDVSFEYDGLLDKCSEDSLDIINRDANRTFAGTIGNARAGQELIQTLIRILMSYAGYDTELGYTQGMNFVVSIPLILSKDEKKSFYIFYGMMNNPLIGIRDIFIEHLPGFFELSKVWMKLLERRYPHIALKLKMCKSVLPALTISRCVQSILIAYEVPLELKMAMFDRLIIFGKMALISFELAVINIFSNEINSKAPEEAQMFLLTVDKLPIFNDIPFIMKAWNEEWISNEEFNEIKSSIQDEP